MKDFIYLLEESFPGIKAGIERCEAAGFPWPSHPFLKEINGEYVSHLGFFEYPLIIEGREYKACALHAICTKAAYQGRGLASELIRQVLSWTEGRYEFVILYTEIPHFYEKLGFQTISESRFHIKYHHSKGSGSLSPIFTPEHDPLLRRCYQERVPLSNDVWMKDLGTITPFNALFTTYPKYSSLNYSQSIDGIIAFDIEDNTLHLYDVVARKIPSLEEILDHLPSPIDEIYFYFPPDLLTQSATAEPFLFDNTYIMVHGNWPTKKPFMIAPLSRC